MGKTDGHMTRSRRDGKNKARIRIGSGTSWNVGLLYHRSRACHPVAQKLPG